jgi:hypothetical protein
VGRGAFRAQRERARIGARVRLFQGRRSFAPDVTLAEVLGALAGVETNLVLEVAALAARAVRD